MEATDEVRSGACAVIEAWKSLPQRFPTRAGLELSWGQYFANRDALIETIVAMAELEGSDVEIEKVECAMTLADRDAERAETIAFVVDAGRSNVIEFSARR